MSSGEGGKSERPKFREEPAQVEQISNGWLVTQITRNLNNWSDEKVVKTYYPEDPLKRTKKKD